MSGAVPRVGPTGPIQDTPLPVKVRLTFEPLTSEERTCPPM